MSLTSAFSRVCPSLRTRTELFLRLPEAPVVDAEGLNEQLELAGAAGADVPVVDEPLLEEMVGLGRKVPDAVRDGRVTGRALVTLGAGARRSRRFRCSSSSRGRLALPWPKRCCRSTLPAAGQGCRSAPSARPVPALANGLIRACLAEAILGRFAEDIAPQRYSLGVGHDGESTAIEPVSGDRNTGSTAVHVLHQNGSSAVRTQCVVRTRNGHALSAAQLGAAIGIPRRGCRIVNVVTDELESARPLPSLTGHIHRCATTREIRVAYGEVAGAKTITRSAVTRSSVTWSPVTTMGPSTLTFRTALPSPEMVSPRVSLALFSLLPGFTTVLTCDAARTPLAPVFVASGFVKQLTGAEAAGEPMMPAVSRPMTVAPASVAASAGRRPLASAPGHREGVICLA